MINTQPVAFHRSRQAVGVGSFLRHYLRGRLTGTRNAVPCGTCTACCRHFDQIELRPERGDALDQYEHTVEGGHAYLARREDGACVYLGDTGCTIWARRPHTCRVFDCRVALLLGEATYQGLRTHVAAHPEVAEAGLVRILDAVFQQFALVAKAPGDQDLLADIQARLREAARRDPLTHHGPFELIERVLAEYAAPTLTSR